MTFLATANTAFITKGGKQREWKKKSRGILSLCSIRSNQRQTFKSSSFSLLYHCESCCTPFDQAVNMSLGVSDIVHTDCFGYSRPQHLFSISQPLPFSNPFVPATCCRSASWVISWCIIVHRGTGMVRRSLMPRTSQSMRRSDKHWQREWRRSTQRSSPNNDELREWLGKTKAGTPGKKEKTGKIARNQCFYRFQSDSLFSRQK